MTEKEEGWLSMSMQDVNKKNREQQNRSEIDKSKSEYECLGYYLMHKPDIYGEELELAKKKYAELKAYFGNEHEKEQKECTEI